VYLFECCYQQALNTVQPSAKREGFASIPDVTWDDIGALDHIKEELALCILVRMVCMCVVYVRTILMWLIV